MKLNDTHGVPACEPTSTACAMPGWCEAFKKCAKREGKAPVSGVPEVGK